MSVSVVSVALLASIYTVNGAYYIPERNIWKSEGIQVAYNYRNNTDYTSPLQPNKFDEDALLKKLSVGDACSGSDCTNYDTLGVGSYMIYNNNQWGASSAKSGYYQCINANDGSVNSGNQVGCVSYEYWASDQTNSHVMGYPSLVAGWNFGSYVSSEGAGGLPVQAYKNASIMVSWGVSHEEDGNYEAYDVSWDLWFSDTSGNTDPSDPSGELMIWITNLNSEPCGSVVQNVNFWGITWELWVGTGGAGTPIWSFRNTGSTWGVSNVDLNDPISFLVENGYINGAQYLLGIQCGQEVMQGQGSFTHTSYSYQVGSGKVDKI